MIIILPKNTEYNLGNDFPLITIPMTMENAESASFEDFQWWSYSKDFRNWLKANPRQWVADSEDLSKYSGSLTEYLRECMERYDEESLLSESSVISFEDFERMLSENENLFEDDGDSGAASVDDQATVKEAVKFHFAYNKLKSDGTLKESATADQIATGDDKAVFLVLEDPESKENLLETLKAFRMKGFTDTAAESKFTLINVTEMVPGGPVAEDDSPENVVGKIVQDATILATTAGAGVLIFGALKVAGGALGTQALLKTIRGFSPSAAAKAASTAAKPGLWSKAGKFTAGKLKSIWGIAKEMATLKNTRIAAQGAARGFRGAKAAFMLGKQGVGGALKAFGKGFARGFSKAGGKAIPFVGEVLMVIDAVGSTWNWFSSNQAPRYGEVDSFAHNSLDPASIPVGVPITICWSQPAGGWGGAAVSFFFSNETRTTCELVKIGVRDNYSIFILTQVNSAEVQKQLASHDLVLIALDNSDKVNDQPEDAGNILTKAAKYVQRTFDNEDMDFKMSFVDGIDKIAALFNFQGMCDWNTFISEYNNASDQLIIADENAPATYQFYYTDSEDNIINVAGRLLTSEELATTSDTDIEKIFYPIEGGEDVFGKVKKRGEGEVAEESEGFDSYGLNILMESSGVITSFSDFNSSLTKANLGIFEAGGSSGNPDEGSGDPDSQGVGASTADLSPDDKMEPAKVAIYKVTDREYANPELRKYKAGVFTQFILTEESFDAKANESIGVDVNTTGEDLEDPRRGVYAYKRKEDTPKPPVDPDKDKDKDKDKEEDVKRDQQPDVEKTEDDYFLKVNPKDVEIKDKRNSTVIRDKSVEGGINILDEFLDAKKKEILGISDWKAITFAKSMLDAKGEVTEVKLKNRFAPFGDKIRKYRVTDGESFEIAKKFAEDVEARIKYE